MNIIPTNGDTWRAAQYLAALELFIPIVKGVITFRDGDTSLITAHHKRATQIYDEMAETPTF
jgi:hypothetical protein